ncbi:MAG: dockerin type I domain-containing protein [Syntrophobacteraceae bacterium]
MRKRARPRLWLLGALLPLLLTGGAIAQDFSSYGAATSEIQLPVVGGGDPSSWFTAAEYFPAGSTSMVGGYGVAGRLIAATGKKVYMQRNYGSSEWDVVATVGAEMDPSFIRVSPDGSRIALGIGYGAPMLVFSTTMLNATIPPVLHDGSNPASGVTAYDINYYDADWVDNQYIVVNGGVWPGPPYGSGVGVVDANNPNDEGVGLIEDIPGASASIAVDSSGNLYTGIGYATGPPNRTGEIKVWAAGEWSTTPSTMLDYEDNDRIVADNVLSAAYLGTDSEGNLHVGGGDAFGTGGTTENGYAALIGQAVVARVTASGTPGAPVSESSSTEYRSFAPDPCRNDSATGILYGDWGHGMAVNWNPTNDTCNSGAADDYWMSGIQPRLTIYYTDSAPDQDSDGIPDSADNAYLTANANQEDSDGDGWGNAADADYNNDGVVSAKDLATLQKAFGATSGDANYNENVDMNSDSKINSRDLNSLRTRFGDSAPYY